PSGLVSGERKPISTLSPFRRPTSSSLGAATLTTTSASHAAAGSEAMRAPACSYRASGIIAASPAPACASTSWPLPASLRTTSGTSATRRSPAAVSLGTAIFMAGGAGTLLIDEVAGGEPGEHRIPDQRGRDAGRSHPGAAGAAGPAAPRGGGARARRRGRRSPGGAGSRSSHGAEREGLPRQRSQGLRGDP